MVRCLGLVQHRTSIQDNRRHALQFILLRRCLHSTLREALNVLSYLSIAPAGSRPPCLVSHQISHLLPPFMKSWIEISVHRKLGVSENANLLQ
jgi:hypothetical protein